MRMDAPSNIGGIAPIILLDTCGAITTSICNSTSGIPYSEYYHKDDALCIMDGTPSVARCGCPLGYYASRMFYGPCLACPNGKSSINSGAETKDKCTSCGSGQFQSIVSGVLSCKICPAGYYQITSGQPTCTACQTGQYLTQDNSKASDHSLKAQCLPCQPGRSFSNIVTECPVCPSGQYQNEITSDGRNCTLTIRNCFEVTCLLISFCLFFLSLAASCQVRFAQLGFHWPTTVSILHTTSTSVIACDAQKVVVAHLGRRIVRIALLGGRKIPKRRLHHALPALLEGMLLLRIQPVATIVPSVVIPTKQEQCCANFVPPVNQVLHRLQ